MVLLANLAGAVFNPMQMLTLILLSMTSAAKEDGCVVVVTGPPAQVNLFRPGHIAIQYLEVKG